MLKEAGPKSRAHVNGTYTMPDGSTRPWDYDTVRKITKSSDRGTRTATIASEDEFDPTKIDAVGLRAAA